MGFQNQEKRYFKKTLRYFSKVDFFLNTHFFLLLINRTGRRRHSSTDAFFFPLYNTNVTFVKGLVTFVFLYLTWAYQVVDFSNTGFQKTNFLEPHTVLLQHLQKNYIRKKNGSIQKYFWISTFH